MLKNNEQLVSETQKAIDKVMDLVTASIQGVEKITHVQLETSRQILEETSKAVREFANITDPKELFARINQIAANAIERNIASARDVYSIVNEVQSKVGKVTEENMQNLQQAALSSVEGVSQYNPNGANFASDMIKTWFNGTAQALSATNKFAAQVSEFANNNIKAATTATANATKKAAAAK